MVREENIAPTRLSPAEEIHRVSTGDKGMVPLIDSKNSFRRSKKLLSVLERMRDDVSVDRPMTPLLSRSPSDGRRDEQVTHRPSFGVEQRDGVVEDVQQNAASRPEGSRPTMLFEDQRIGALTTVPDAETQHQEREELIRAQITEALRDQIGKTEQPKSEGVASLLDKSSSDDMRPSLSDVLADPSREMTEKPGDSRLKDLPTRAADLRLSNPAKPSQRKTSNHIPLEASMSSEDSDDDSLLSLDSSGSSNSDYGSTASSSSGYSSSSSRRQRATGRKKRMQAKQARKRGMGKLQGKRPNLPGQAARRPFPVRSIRPSVVSADAPLADRATEFVTRLVEQLAFGLPENVKDHARSEPIVATDEQGRSGSRNDQAEDNSIVGGGTAVGLKSKKLYSPPNEDSIKTAISGLKRTGLSDQGQPIPMKDTKTKTQPDLCPDDDPASTQRPPILEKGKKAASQVVKASCENIEATPQLVSAEADSARSRRTVDSKFQPNAACGAQACGDFLPFFAQDTPKQEGTDHNRPEPPKWTATDFLSLNEAILALQKSTESPDGLSTQGADKVETSAESTVNTGDNSASNALERVNLAVSSDTEEHRQKMQSKVNNEQETSSLTYSVVTDEDKVIVGENGGKKFAASTSTSFEDMELQKLSLSGSGDSSIVPLKHGQRGLNEHSTMPKYGKTGALAGLISRFEEGPSQFVPKARPTPLEEELPPAGLPVMQQAGSQAISSTGTQVEALEVVLSLSANTEEIVPALQPKQESNPKVASAQPDSTNQKTSSHGAKKTKSAGFGAKSNDPNARENHQQELRDRINQFQRRLAQKHEAGGTMTDVGGGASSASSTSFTKPVKRSNGTPLPKASRRIAQSYVDALSKKYPPAQDFLSPLMANDSKTPLDQEKRSVASETTHSLGLDTLTNAVSNGKEGGEIESGNGHGQVPRAISFGDQFPKISQAPRTVPRENDQQGKKSTPFDQLMSSLSIPSTGSGVSVDNLVSRIDDVVQRLVQSGKLETKPNANTEPGSQERMSNATELLRNLAILRSRRSKEIVTVESLAASIPSKSVVPQARQPAGTPATEGKTFDKSHIAMLRARRDRAAEIIRKETKKLAEREVAPMDSGLAVRLAGHEKLKRANRSIGDDGRLPQKSAYLKAQQERAMNHVNFVDLVDPQPSTRKSGTPAKSRRSGPPKPESFESSLDEGTPRAPKPVISTRDDNSWSSQTNASSSGSESAVRSTPRHREIQNWEQGELDKLPQLLSAESDQPEEVVSLEEYSSYETDTDEETEADFESDDDSERLNRIEDMIHELRARRKK